MKAQPVVNANETAMTLCSESDSVHLRDVIAEVVK
jgi:hypothetical protein